MKGNIVIIHGSRIVTTGLATLLKYRYPVDVLEINSWRQFTKSRLGKGINLIMADSIFREEMIKIKTKIIVPVIAISNSINVEKSIVFDDYIFIGDKDELIFEKCKPYLTPRSTGKQDKEGQKLTSREEEVLQQVALGLSNKEIAKALYISIHTVISHRKSISQKTGIKSISGLTIYALLNNLIDPSANSELLR